MRKSLLSSAVAASMLFVAAPALAIDVGGSIGGGGSASASGGSRGGGGLGGSIGGSTRASAGGSVGLGSRLGGLGSSGNLDAGVTANASGSASTGTSPLATSLAASGSADANTQASANTADPSHVSLAGGLAGSAVVTSDGERVGTVVGIGVDATGQPAVVFTNIGGFLGLGSTPVRFDLEATTITETQVQLQATEAQLSAFIQAEKSAAVRATETGAATAEVASNAAVGGSAALSQ
jgi:fibronectin-binding autotransporter adhesin